MTLPTREQLQEALNQYPRGLGVLATDDIDYGVLRIIEAAAKAMLEAPELDWCATHNLPRNSAVLEVECDGIGYVKDCRMVFACVLVEQ